MFFVKNAVILVIINKGVYPVHLNKPVASSFTPFNPSIIRHHILPDASD
jgi:hypothetical protein